MFSKSKINDPAPKEDAAKPAAPTASAVAPAPSAPKAKPPVAKILNYGKLKYEEKKKAQASKKKQHVVKIKEMRVRPRIDDHDLETKVSRGRKFLTDGCKLKVTLMFRGREMSRIDLGTDVLNRVIDMLSDIAEVEKHGELEGRRQTIVLTGK